MSDALTPCEALLACRDAAGSDSALARMLSDQDATVTQPRVWRWVNRTKLMPAEFVLKAERLFGVSRHHLRPDIYPIEVNATYTSRCAGVDPRAALRKSIIDRGPLQVAFNSPGEAKGVAA